MSGQLLEGVEEYRTEHKRVFGDEEQDQRDEYNDKSDPFGIHAPVTEEERKHAKWAQSDPVNHPEHYNQGKYETIDVIEDADLGYHLSAALKYILRCNYKGKIDEDLAKAVWYIERYRKLLRDKNTVSELSGEQGDS